MYMKILCQGKILKRFKNSQKSLNKKRFANAKHNSFAAEKAIKIYLWLAMRENILFCFNTISLRSYHDGIVFWLIRFRNEQNGIVDLDIGPFSSDCTILTDAVKHATTKPIKSFLPCLISIVPLTRNAKNVTKKQTVSFS